MKTTGNKASEDRMKIVAVAVFVVIAAALIYFEYFYTGTPAAPATAVVETTPAASPSNTVAAGPVVMGGPAAKVVGTSSTALDPTLHMDAMLVSESVVYSGSGRNIFSPNSAPPVVIPKPITTARPNLVATQVQRPVPPAVVPCPPNCPPIDLKFFGIETSLSTGAKQAFLLHDDTVYTASAGDVVLRRYRVISIEAKAIQVEDMQNNNKQTLPLLAN